MMHAAFRPVVILSVPALALCLALAGCDRDAGDAPAEGDRTQVAPPPAPIRSAEPLGDPVNAPAVSGQRLQEAASVMQVHAMPEQGAKVFGVSGGDPAINGLVTYLGLYAGVAEGWRLYEIGNFETWRVTEVATHRVVLDVSESRLDPTSGEIITEDRRLIVGFAGDEAAPPSSVSITPAR
jgi:hypothetical protein